MRQSVKMLTLDRFPPAPSLGGQDPVTPITRYLRELLNERMAADGAQVLLPGLEELAGFFGVPQLDVFDAFQNLRREELDYSLEGFSAPIAFWKNPLSH